METALLSLELVGYRDVFDTRPSTPKAGDHFISCGRAASS
jgi:hypothetical protein